MPELIARIPSNVTRALLSNSNALHWPRVEDEFGLGALFEHRFVSHLTGRIKPDRDAFEHVISSLGCDAASVFFLDDNLMNVEAARDAGMQGAVVRGVDEAEQALRLAVHHFLTKPPAGQAKAVQAAAGLFRRGRRRTLSGDSFRLRQRHG